MKSLRERVSAIRPCRPARVSASFSQNDADGLMCHRATMAAQTLRKSPECISALASPDVGAGRGDVHGWANGHGGTTEAVPASRARKRAT
jgi:hypothetical protein